MLSDTSPNFRNGPVTISSLSTAHLIATLMDCNTVFTRRPDNVFPSMIVPSIISSNKNTYCTAISVFLKGFISKTSVPDSPTFGFNFKKG